MESQVSEYNKSYYERNKEKLKEQTRQYKKNNRIKVRERNRLYAEKNKERVKEWRKRSYDKCKESYNDKKKKKYQEYCAWLDEYKKSRYCVHCGETDVVCLDFHHIDPSIKEIQISKSQYGTTPEKIMREIEKCIVLCSNCHRKEHARLRNDRGNGTKNGSRGSVEIRAEGTQGTLFT